MLELSKTRIDKRAIYYWLDGIGVFIIGVLVGLISTSSFMAAFAFALVVTVALFLTLVPSRSDGLPLWRILVLFIVVSILLPPIRFPADIPDVRFELILVLITWAFLILRHFVKGKPIRFQHNILYKWFLIWWFCMFTSVAYAAWVKGYYLAFRDTFEFLKLFEYFLIFVFASNMDIKKEDMQRFYYISLLVFLAAAAVGFAQYINLLGINSIISPYYAPTQIRGLLIHKRITGTTSNPNEFGALMVMGISLALSGALMLQKKKLRIFAWGVVAILGLAVVLTLSRAALVAMGAVVVFILFYKFPAMMGIRKSTGRLLSATLVLMLFALFLIIVAPPKFFIRMDSMYNLITDTSWQDRQAIWSANLSVWQESPLFGWGPGKADMTTIVDNEWLLILRRYGIIGAGVFITLFVSLYRQISFITSKSQDEVTKVFGMAIQSVFVAYTLYMIPAAVYHSLQLMPLLMFYAGLISSQVK